MSGLLEIAVACGLVLMRPTKAVAEPPWSLMPSLIFAAAFVGIGSLLCAANVAHADVAISSAATSNMSCFKGVCAPTATDAVLNASDLTTLLASGNIEVTTTGSGVQANNIDVDATVSWSSAYTLALDAYESILVEDSVSVGSLGGLSITTDDGGSGGFFGFGAKGHVTFANLSSALTINGSAYTLEGDIKSLAAAVAAYSAGDYALANSYDASKDRAYQNSPIPTEFSGSFEGLGNTISHLKLNGTGNINDYVGLFAELASGNGSGGMIENINLHNLYVGGNGYIVGGLVGVSTGTINGSFVSGTMYVVFQQNTGPQIGFLAAVNAGTIVRSGAEGSSTGSQLASIGGLVGDNSGSITQSYADCTIAGDGMSGLGGLAGYSLGSISQSYGEGVISDVGAGDSDIGELVGENAEASAVSQSYSTTALKDIGRKDSGAGGLIGIDESQAGSISVSYWDTSTSHIKSLKRGAGTPKSDPGIKGLTTEVLQSGLPEGFDSTVWAEDAKINNGLPYLIANPPEKK